MKQLRLCKTQHFEFLLESISGIQSCIVVSEVFEAEAQFVLQKLLKYKPRATGKTNLDFGRLEILLEIVTSRS